MIQINQNDLRRSLYFHNLLMLFHKVLRQCVANKALCSKKGVEQSIGLVQIGKHLL